MTAVSPLVATVTRASRNGTRIRAASRWHLGAALRVTDELLFSQHALGKMIERGIDVATARSVWEANDAIEIYLDDTPYPSALYLGWVGGRPIHLVAARADDGRVVVITIDEPDAERWDATFRRRTR